MTRNENVLNKFSEVNKAKHLESEAKEAVKQAKEVYREALLDQTIEQLIEVQKEGKPLTERDFKIFLNALTIDVKNLYSK